MDRIWFLLYKGQTFGPMTTDEVHTGLDRGHWTSQTLVWWKGSKQWVPLIIWRAHLGTIVESLQKKASSRTWYVKVGNENSGPYTDQQLVQKIASLHSQTNALLWTPGLSTWRSVFEFREIATALGIPPRQTPRIEMDGNVKLPVAEGQQIVMALDTIGAGGAGFHAGDHLFPGQLVNISIESPILPLIVHATAEVLYKKLDSGLTGVKFTSIPQEARATIIDIVKELTEREEKTAA